MLVYEKTDAPSDRPGEGIHNPKFGEILKAEMEKLGLSCDPFIEKGGRDLDKLEFFQKQFAAKDKPPGR